jgi:hypothetical protein
LDLLEGFPEDGSQHSEVVDCGLAASVDTFVCLLIEFLHHGQDACFDANALLFYLLYFPLEF